MEELQYHEQRDLKNKKKLQELLAALPPFCADFFRGIEPATSSMTRLSYAYDISTFFDFLRKLKPELEKLSVKFHQAIENAVQEENARWEDKDNRITVTFEQKGKRPAGTQDKSCQIVQAANAANQALGMETLYIGAASTDANIPISLGIPAITVGWGGKGGGEHTIHEWYEHTESWKGPQRDLLLLLALSGYEEYKKYQLPHINVK